MQVYDLSLPRTAHHAARSLAVCRRLFRLPWYNQGMPAPMTLASRRPHFRRHAPPNLRLTDDDIAIVRYVAKHRFLRSTHIVRLLQRSPKKVVERLGAPLSHRLPRSPARPARLLRHRQAPALRLRAGQPRRRPSRRDQRRAAAESRLDRQEPRGRASLPRARAACCRRDGGCRTCPQGAIRRAAHRTRSNPSWRARGYAAGTNPFKFSVRVNVNGFAGELSVIPDRVFGLDFTRERKRTYFFLEADRATMPILRSNLAQTSMYRKFLAYAAGGGASNLFGKQLGIGSFRLLTVTTSPERTANMLDAVVQATRGSRQFLFSDRLQLVSAPNLPGPRLAVGKRRIRAPQ